MSKEKKEQEMEKILEREMGWDVEHPNTKEEHEMNMDTNTENCELVVDEFVNRGLPKDKIQPKENVFTYKKWQKLGRQVKKGEKGVKICWLAKLPPHKTDKDKIGWRHLVRSVFHISQTEKIETQ